MISTTLSLDFFFNVVFFFRLFQVAAEEKDEMEHPHGSRMATPLQVKLTSERNKTSLPIVTSFSWTRPGDDRLLIPDCDFFYPIVTS